jgi:hypothetical protein
VKAIVKFRDGTQWASWMTGDSAAAALTRAVQVAESIYDEDHAGAWLYPGLDPLDGILGPANG